MAHSSLAPGLGRETGPAVTRTVGAPEIGPKVVMAGIKTEKLDTAPEATDQATENLVGQAVGTAAKGIGQVAKEVAGGMFQTHFRRLATSAREGQRYLEQKQEDGLPPSLSRLAKLGASVLDGMNQPLEALDQLTVNAFGVALGTVGIPLPIVIAIRIAFGIESDTTGRGSKDTGPEPKAPVPSQFQSPGQISLPVAQAA